MSHAAGKIAAAIRGQIENVLLNVQNVTLSLHGEFNGLLQGGAAVGVTSSLAAHKAADR
jgi:hypothetical protein